MEYKVMNIYCIGPQAAIKYELILLSFVQFSQDHRGYSNTMKVYYGIMLELSVLQSHHSCATIYVVKYFFMTLK